MVDERAHLELADRHIRDAKERIVEQESLIQGLTMTGRDTDEAEIILKTFREILDAFLDHRALIVEAMEKQAIQATPAETPRG